LPVKNRRRIAGFSLVELMIVIVVSGILSAIGLPMYFNHTYSAKRTEAIAALGSIKSELKLYYGENGYFPVVAEEDYVIGADWNDIKVGELSGKNFFDSSYFYVCTDGVRWELKVDKNTTMLEEDLILKYDGTLIGIY
jgi:prepilin-type N-terminal cleavage/methylation domain-containing protein